MKAIVLKICPTYEADTFSTSKNLSLIGLARPKIVTATLSSEFA